MTESAAFSSAAQKDCYEELGVERYTWICSFDKDTCQLCGSMDGQVFRLSDYQVGLTAPPGHPWCRCCTAPYFEDMAKLGERWSRNPDGTTEMVPGDMTFEEWKKQFADGGLKTAPIDDTMQVRGMAMGLRRSLSHILTEDEIASIKADAEALGIDLSVLRFNAGRQTGFSDSIGLINIRGDILPDLESSIARDRMSQRAVLAHEYYGHFKHHPSEYPIGDWRDEFRASYSAAIDAPNLTDEDRRYLMLDAYDRAKEAGAFEGYDEIARRIIHGY